MNSPLSPPGQIELLESIKAVEQLDKHRSHRQVTQTIIDLLTNNPCLAFNKDNKEIMKKYAENISACCDKSTSRLQNEQNLAKHLNGVLGYVNGLITLQQDQTKFPASKRRITNALKRLHEDTRFRSKHPDIEYIISKINIQSRDSSTENVIKRFNDDAGDIENYLNHDGNQRNKLKNNMVKTIDALKFYLSNRPD